MKQLLYSTVIAMSVVTFSGCNSSTGETSVNIIPISSFAERSVNAYSEEEFIKLDKEFETFSNIEKHNALEEIRKLESQKMEEDNLGDNKQAKSSLKDNERDEKEAKILKEAVKLADDKYQKLFYELSEELMDDLLKEAESSLGFSTIEKLQRISRSRPCYFNTYPDIVRYSPARRTNTVRRIGVARNDRHDISDCDVELRYSRPAYGGVYGKTFMTRRLLNSYVIGFSGTVIARNNYRILLLGGRRTACLLLGKCKASDENRNTLLSYQMVRKLRNIVTF